MKKWCTIDKTAILTLHDKNIFSNKPAGFNTDPTVKNIMLKRIKAHNTIS